MCLFHKFCFNSSPTEVRQEVWRGHQVLPERAQVWPREHPDLEGLVLASDPDEGPRRIQGSLHFFWRLSPDKGEPESELRLSSKRLHYCKEYTRGHSQEVSQPGLLKAILSMRMFFDLSNWEQYSSGLLTWRAVENKVLFGRASINQAAGLGLSEAAEYCSFQDVLNGTIFFRKLATSSSSCGPPSEHPGSALPCHITSSTTTKRLSRSWMSSGKPSRFVSYWFGFPTHA